MEEQEKNSESDIIHDFIHENLTFKVFGGHYVMQKPMSLFVINVLLMSCVFLMLLFLTLTGIYTFIVWANTASLKIQILFMLIFMFNSFVVPAIRYFYRRNVMKAFNILKAGIDQYSHEIPEQEHKNIKRKRVEQVRSWSFAIGVLCYLSAVSNTVQSPIMQLISSEKNDTNSTINLYLPLPLFMPFDTTTYHGYIIAFLSNTIYLFIMYTALFCVSDLYLSSALQLLAQVEILNYSLSNIQKRAAMKLKPFNAYLAGDCSPIKENSQLQKNLYLCLRTNIQHHQRISRFAQEVKEYLGAMNTLHLINFGLIFATSVVPLIKSADTMNILYSTPWTHCNKRYNILLNLMMTSAQKEIVLRSPFFNLDWTLETFGAVLTGAYKLVNLLLNTT